MLRVAIIGAGLGGLCLAHGLRRGGASVTVYERDADVATRYQGYRIHIGPMGARALADCLPPESYELFLATAGQPGRQITVLSRRLRQLKVMRGQIADGEVSVPADRQTLRAIMLAGLPEHVRFGHELTRFEEAGDHVSAFFRNGARADADVLVGADGVNSAVRAQLLPVAQPVISGALVCGRTPLDDTTRPLLPGAVHEGFVAVTGFPRPAGLALGLMEFGQRPARFGLPDRGDYLMWGLGAQARWFPRDLRDLAPADLRDSVLRLIRRWHPDLRELVRWSDLASTFALAVRTGIEVPAWPASRVTVLGDAIHAMSPAGGSGGNVALHDAAELCRRLISADPADPVPAIAAYERDMTRYGFAAMRASRAASRGLSR
jgi:2-polyprenyl-6-methoxyphenol hydroxylase-like FAD-dependent oxidoreductase